MANPLDLNYIGSIVMAVGGLGLAACALVDASKAMPGGGVSQRGFEFVEALVRRFLPQARTVPDGADLHEALLRCLQANWINGMAGADQRAVAKSMLKLQLTPETAAVYARVANVDPAALREVAARMHSGEPLTEAQMTVLGRFDLALTALTDAAYHRGEQRYRNVSKAWAAVVAVVLAVLGGWALQGTPTQDAQGLQQVVVHVLLGLLAVPLAPITKDLTSALQAGAKAVASLRR